MTEVSRNRVFQKLKRNYRFMTDDETLSSHPFSHPRYKDNHSEDNNFRQNSKSRVRSR
jgi:hypothetical protein